MSEISIKIKIAERTYPMRVKQEDEARIREAGKVINDRITKYMSKFGIGDKQDLLAMVAFDCLIESAPNVKNTINDHSVKKLESILSSIEKVL